MREVSAQAVQRGGARYPKRGHPVNEFPTTIDVDQLRGAVGTRGGELPHGQLEHGAAGRALLYGAA